MVRVVKVLLLKASVSFLNFILVYFLCIIPRGLEGPTPTEPIVLFALKFFLGCFLLDTYQYFMHRWMHQNRWLYRNIHSVHHQLTIPYAFGALYNHPLEGFLMDTIGGGLASLPLDMSPPCSAAFFCFATLKTVDDHCGFDFPLDPFQFLFPNNAKFHDVHHWGKGRNYNFSQPFFTWWDEIFGTVCPLSEKDRAGGEGSTEETDFLNAEEEISERSALNLASEEKKDPSSELMEDDSLLSTNLKFSHLNLRPVFSSAVESSEENSEERVKDIVRADSGFIFHN